MDIKIFGCKVNKYYTDKWINSEYLKWKKWIFIATCVVTDKAKRKWLKFVKDTSKNLKNDEKLFISWCWAFKDGKAQTDFYDLYPEINYLKEKIVLLDEDPGLIKKLELPKNLYTKKFVLIQWWCDSFCSFCLTVKKRWAHFSRKKENILKEILDFEKNWWKEVVLTWINLSAWWLDSTNPPPNPLPPKEGKCNISSKFAKLLKYLLDNTKISRIRISSMWPEFITDEVLEILKETRIYPHFHYSIQSGSSKILKSMARHYDWKYMRKLLEKTRKIKRKDCVKVSIWADIIVWFPGETETDFKDTLDLINEYKINKVHAFPFSWHHIWENVPAWKYPNQVDDKTKKERMWKIMNLADEIRDEFIESNIWDELEVLIELVKNSSQQGGFSPLKWKWWTQNYIEADNTNFKIISGEIKLNKYVLYYNHNLNNSWFYKQILCFHFFTRKN